MDSNAPLVTARLLRCGTNLLDPDSSMDACLAVLTHGLIHVTGKFRSIKSGAEYKRGWHPTLGAAALRGTAKPCPGIFERTEDSRNNN